MNKENVCSCLDSTKCNEVVMVALALRATSAKNTKTASITMQITVLLWASGQIKKTSSKFSVRPFSLDHGSWLGPSGIAVLLT